jgi:hypothetical protein
MAPKLSPNAQKVSDFLAKVVMDIVTEQGIKIGISDMGVLTAGKKLGAKEYLPVLQVTLNRLVTEHPELAEMLLAGATEQVKERIRKAAGMGS